MLPRAGVDMGVICALPCTACDVWTSLLAPTSIIENNSTKLHLFDCECSFQDFLNTRVCILVGFHNTLSALSEWLF